MFRSKSGTKGHQKTRKRKYKTSSPPSSEPVLPLPSLTPLVPSGLGAPRLPKPIETFNRSFSVASADSTPCIQTSLDRCDIGSKLQELSPHKADDDELTTEEIWGLCHQPHAQGAQLIDQINAEDAFAAELSALIAGEDTEKTEIQGISNPLTIKVTDQIDEPVDLTQIKLVELTEDQAKEALEKSSDDQPLVESEDGRSNPLVFTTALCTVPTADASTPKP